MLSWLKVCKENIPYKITCYMLLYSWDSSNHRTFSCSSVVQFCWASAKCNLSFRFSECLHSVAAILCTDVPSWRSWTTCVTWVGCRYHPFSWVVVSLLTWPFLPGLSHRFPVAKLFEVFAATEGFNMILSLGFSLIAKCSFFCLFVCLLVLVLKERPFSI